jgi:hypothetical protein
MRKTLINLNAEQKAKMLDDIADIIITCQEGVMHAPADIVRHYKTPAGYAGYKIQRYLYDNRIIEPGEAQERLNV